MCLKCPSSDVLALAQLWVKESKGKVSESIKAR